MVTSKATLDNYFRLLKRTLESVTNSESDEEPSVSPPKQKVYKRSFSSSWLERIVWLRHNENRDRMYCEETSKDNTYTAGCKNFRISDIQKHLRSRNHSTSTETYIMKKLGATVTTALLTLATVYEEAVIAALRNIYWLAKEDVASLKYNSLNELTKLQGCNNITHLHVGENAKYSSPEVVKEMQLAISNCI